MDEVSKLVPNQLGVEDCFDFPFFLTGDNKRWWRLLCAAWNNIGTEAFQQLYVEDRMDLHRLRQFESKRSCPNLLKNAERSDALVIELAGWSVCL